MKSAKRKKRNPKRRKAIDAQGQPRENIKSGHLLMPQELQFGVAPEKFGKAKNEKTRTYRYNKRRTIYSS